jgi:hypothetical protein
MRGVIIALGGLVTVCYSKQCGAFGRRFYFCPPPNVAPGHAVGVSGHVRPRPDTLICNHQNWVSDMDWQSETTKKHIKEAEVQGCKLLDAGKDRRYRLYALPCGHRQEVGLGNMRVGNFNCHDCLTKKHMKEAEAHGCKLLGAGRSSNYRIYRLSCGHEQEVDAGMMRKGVFKCRPCLDQRLVAEAKAQSCKLLRDGTRKASRIYRLSCGHEQEISLQSMRNGGFKCGQCLDHKLEAEAAARDCELVGIGRNASYKTYQLPCRHKQEMQTGAMRLGKFECRICLDQKLKAEAKAQKCKLLRDGSRKGCRFYELPCRHEQEVDMGCMRVGRFKCQTCFDQSLKLEAEAQGCKLLGDGRNTQIRNYLLSCGHEQEVFTTMMRTGEFQCSSCTERTHAVEAEAHNCELLGAAPERGTHYRTYRLSCGHERAISLQNMRLGDFLCQTCEETSRTLPSNVYLLHIKVDSDEWLKLGFAKIVDTRVSKYGLPQGAVVTTVYSLPFDTGNEAHAVEADIHKRYKRKRLTKKQMEVFHAKSGFNECYPLTMLDTLLAELEVLKAEQAG